MGNGPFIDGLPIKNGDFPWRTVSHTVTRWLIMLFFDCLSQAWLWSNNMNVFQSRAPLPIIWWCPSLFITSAGRYLSHWLCKESGSYCFLWDVWNPMRHKISQDDANIFRLCFRWNMQKRSVAICCHRNVIQQISLGQLISWFSADYIYMYIWRCSTIRKVYMYI